MFALGILFILLSNYFRILAPQVSGYVVDKVARLLLQQQHQPLPLPKSSDHYDVCVRYLIQLIDDYHISFANITILCGLLLLLLALLGGFFMFLMRQTIIVMSRHIEYDQKNEVYGHYQRLDATFYKTHSTGDLMNRISEDVSKVRMYTGPAIMYVINLTATICFSIFFMVKESWELTLYVLAPLPILAVTIFKVNTIIHQKSEKIQSLLSDLTTTAQETYSGIRVIKSFVQESAMMRFFSSNSHLYCSNAVQMAKVEAIYFPAIALLIGLSTLFTIGIGSWYVMQGNNDVTAGTITEFVIYVNLLTFPVSAIGWTAGMIQRAAASQKRLNEFLNAQSAIQTNNQPLEVPISDIVFNNVSFTYAHTGITAIKNLSLHIKKGSKVLVLGKTGSGKTTLAQLLLRFYDVSSGSITIHNQPIQNLSVKWLRNQISYVPQDVFLFSDTIANNIGFGLEQKPTHAQVTKAAEFAHIDQEIGKFAQGYETVVGERGVTLSGGQKQRIAIARTLIKEPQLVIFDDCLSAVDANTEKVIADNFNQYLHEKTAIMITHRIFTSFVFDHIIVLHEGAIIEEGNHEVLMEKNGYYAQLYRTQRIEDVSAYN